MSGDSTHVSIILLNWNGWGDTIECLESILKQTYMTYNIILIDNNSTDDSLLQIKNWASGGNNVPIETRYPELVLPPVSKPVEIVEYQGMENDPALEKQSILLVKNSENLGFARANNQGMALARRLFNSEYYFLLNNDTVIDKNAVNALVQILTTETRIKVSQSTIYSYSENKIVNAGGKIFFWGQTRHFKSIGASEIRDISFVNGCALFVRSSLIDEYGPLSEKFFHGEEDFEFSMRMNKNRQRMICSGESRIYHKVGRAVKNLMKNYERRTFLFALNRMVDLKDYLPAYVWRIWRFFTLTYFLYLFSLKYRVPLRRAFFLLGKIHEYSEKLNDVQKESLDRINKDVNLW